MSENKDILLDIRDLSVQFNTDSGVVKAVNHLNMHLERGKSLGFVGETGAGKTTTALSILQLVQTPPGEITGGEILFNGTDVRRMTD
ncbi:MAG: ATP-binding cassette domain-containing protein, partial [Pyramidobacter sp.]|nr:ATP-binding cassette domain-containing protein [Pyramidobacter sp.]